MSPNSPPGVPATVGVPNVGAMAWLARYGAVVVFLVAFVARAIYLFEASIAPYFAQPVLDGRYNWNLAEMWASGAIWNAGPFFRPPLYGAVLGALRALCGDGGIAAAIIGQHLLGCVGAVALFVAGRAAGGLRAGLAAGLLYAVNAPVVFYEGELLSDSLFANLTCFFLASFFVCMRRGGHYLTAGLAGLFAGMALVTRPNILFVLLAFGLLMVLLFVLRHRQVGPSVPSRRRLLVAFVVFLACLIPLPLFATLHNQRAGTPAFVATQGGINFYIGNSPGANGLTVALPIPIMPDSDYRDAVEVYAESAAKQADPTLTRTQISAFWMRKALQFLRDNPGDAATLYGRKILALFNNYEVRNNRDFQFMRTQLSTLRILPVTFGALVVLAAFGLWVVARRPRRRSALGVYIVVGAAAMGLSIILFFVGGRLRLPIVPFMTLLAGIGVAEVWRRAAVARSRRGRVIAHGSTVRRAGVVQVAALAFMLFAASLAAWPWKFLQNPYPAGEWFMLATASADGGQHRAAFDYASRALQEDPKLSLAQNLRGISALNTGQLTAAACDFANLTTHTALAARALNNLAYTAELATDYSTARSLYTAAAQASGADPKHILRAAMLTARLDGSSATSATLASLPAEARQTPMGAALAIASGIVSAPPEGTLPSQVRAALRELSTPLPPQQSPLPAPFDGSWTATCGCPPPVALASSPEQLRR